MWPYNVGDFECVRRRRGAGLVERDLDRKSIVPINRRPAEIR